MADRDLPNSGQPLFIKNRHVECSDCHNARANGRPASPPYVTGRLDKVSDAEVNRAGVEPATCEYEICFKCHADLPPRVHLKSRG